MRSDNRVYFLLIITLLICPYSLPVVSASNEGISIDLSSINLQDFDSIEEDYYQLEFNIDNLGSSGISFGNISVDMQSMSGNSLSSYVESLELSLGETIAFSHNFTSVPYGYVVIVVTIVGDVTTLESTHDSSFQRTLHRLNPLNVSLGQSDSIILEGVDSTGQNSGNLTVNDGDYLQLQIPIINNGDYDWNGYLTVNLTESITSENYTSSIFLVPSMQTIIFYFNSSIIMNEGSVNIILSINDTGDLNQLDESVNFNSSIFPPPLPQLTLLLTQNTSEIIAGEQVFWNLHLSNLGEVNFDGLVTCLFGSETIYNNNLNLSSGSQTNLSISTTARPGILECFVSGDRLSDLSDDSANISLFVESAEFESAGGDNPATLLGPWHDGDTVRLSLLVRNHGSIMGHVKIQCEVDGINYSGSYVELKSDEAGEVIVDVPMLNSGLKMLNWSLESYDGSIDSGLSGTLNLSIFEKQTIEIEIESVTWDEQNGISFDWTVSLSNGVDRDVRIRLGYIDSLTERFLVDNIISLSPGLTGGSINVGFVDAQKVIVRVNEVDWVAGFGFSSVNVDIPSDRPIYSVSFDSQSNPNRPTAGENAEVTLTLENSGELKGSSGILILKTSSGILIEERNIEPLEPKTSSVERFNFIWPEGDEVSLVSTWSVSQQTINTENIFISSVTQTEEESQPIPWSGILGGIALAATIILVIRIRGSNSSGESSISQPKKNKVSNDSEVNLSDVKIQIACPECSRQLRIPSNYSGSVRCPDCEHSFEVEEKKDPTRDIEQNIVEQESNEEEPIEENINDGKIQVSCPDCSQTLRIPESYSGSVRCPACKNIFRT